MKPGDTVIVARRQAFTTQRKPVVGTFVRDVGECGVYVSLLDEEHPANFSHAEVRLYTEALWSAWQQWQRNAQALEEQQRQLCAGRTPVELLTVGMW